MFTPLAILFAAVNVYTHLIGQRSGMQSYKNTNINSLRNSATANGQSY